MQLMDSDQIDQMQNDLASQLQSMQQAQALSLAPSVQGSVEQPMVEQQQPTREQSLKSLIEQQMQSGMNRRQKDIELARMLHAEQLKQPNQVDLTNFFGMANAAGADPKNASYKVPENYNPMVGQAAISKEEGAMTDDQLAYLKAQLDAEQSAKNAQLSLLKSEGTDRRFGFGKDLEIRSKILGSEESKMIKANTILMDKLNKYDEVFKEVGNKASLTGEEKARLDAAQSDAAIAWKESAKLGALQGPDLGMIDKALSQSPTGGNAILGYSLSGGAKGLKSKINTARDSARRSGQYYLENVRTVYPEVAYPVAGDIYNNYQKELDRTYSGKTLYSKEGKDSDKNKKQKKILSPSEYFKKE